MRKAALAEISELVVANSNVVFVGSDLGAGTMAEAATRCPDRVLMEGIAEQFVVGFAAGLALDGFIPYVHTIATFLTRRAIDQIVVDVALQNLPVRLIGGGGGMTYAPLGPTHQAIDDFALMRSIPNMRIFAPADPRECRNILQYLCRSTFPAYVRIARGGEPNFLGALSDLDPGKGRYIFRGEEIAVLSTGSISFECFTAVKGLREAGLSVSFAHFPCVEPLDGKLIAEIALECKEVIVVEEHMASGGLFSAVAEFLARSGASVTLHQVSLPRAFASNFGSQREHWDAHGLSAPQITNLLLQISKRRSNDG